MLRMQEIEAVKGKVEQLTAERDKAMADHVIACQQRDCHANHANLLTRDNKRLFTQLQAQQQEHLSIQRRLQRLKAKPADSSGNVRDAARSAHHKAKAQDEKEQSAACADAHDKRSFEGKDIGNVPGRQPFDLSKRIFKPAVPSSKTVLQQAQQLRLAA